MATKSKSRKSSKQLSRAVKLSMGAIKAHITRCNLAIQGGLRRNEKAEVLARRKALETKLAALA